MRIESVRIENFRSFKNEIVPFNNYACLVGPNGAGKSTVLTALNVFFREFENTSTDLDKLEQEDFHLGNTKSPIRITVTFSDLSEEARKDFSDYVRQDRLVVTAEAAFDSGSGRAEVRQYGQRLGMPELRSFFEALDKGKKVSELKEIYNGFRSKHPDLPAAGTKDAMTKTLREFEANRPDQCKLIPSTDQFYGFSSGVNRLDGHVQWVYVPAVKDATTEQVEARNSALGKLLARTVRSNTGFNETIKELRTQMQTQYQQLLDKHQSALDDISSALQARITEWAHPDVSLRLQWKQDPEKSVRVDIPLAHVLAGEGEFEGELARFGHGLQRSFLLALLQELAATDDAAGPTLILACEEPELYQHPPQARHLAATLSALSRSNAQIIVSTHDPLFVSGQGFEDVRMIRKNPGQPHSGVSHMSFEEIAQAVGAATDTQPVRPEGVLAKIHQALQPSLNEMFFTHKLILVEGLEDVAYLQSYLHLLDQDKKFRQLGAHIVATNGKSQLLQPLVIASHMRIPTYVIFDADADKEHDNPGKRAMHARDNRALLTLLGKPDDDPMPDETCSGPGFTMWHSDIAKIVEEDIGRDEWMRFRQQADNLYGHAGQLHKNLLHIGASLAFAWNAGKHSTNLRQLCTTILNRDNYV